jgi:hypothetical protein
MPALNLRLIVRDSRYLQRRDAGNPISFTFLPAEVIIELILSPQPHMPEDYIVLVTDETLEPPVPTTGEKGWSEEVQNASFISKKSGCPFPS